MKHLILFFCLTGFAFSQVDELQQAKDVLAEQAIQISELKKANRNLVEMTNAFVQELQAIKNPSEELIAIMKKYEIYPEVK